MDHYVFADSKNRDTVLHPHGNTYVLHLTKALRNVAKVELVSAKVPNSVYNLNDGSNCFEVNSVQYSMPPGFYSAYGLADAMSSASCDIVHVEYQPDEGKYIFYSDSSFTLNILSHELKIMTGMTSQHVAVSTSDTVYENKYKGQYYVKSEKIIDLSTNEFVFLDIDELRNQKVLDSKRLVGESYDGATIATSFAMIPLDVVSAQVKTFKETTDYKFSITFEHPIPRISRLTVRWLDKNGRVLNFNGFDNNAFVLRCTCNDSAPEPEPEEDKYELLAKRFERAMQDAIPPPKPEKPRVPVWVFALTTLVLLGIILKVYRRNG